MHKKSTIDAIAKFSEKQIKKQTTRKRRNGSPEKELEKRIKPVIQSLGIFAVVVESKAVYSAAAGMYLSGQTQAGFPDLVGLNNHGTFCAIELKAPGRRSTVRTHQSEFLLNVISRNGFACVTDSVEHFVGIYTKWIGANDEYKKSILLADLPAASRDGMRQAAGLDFED